jgi:hypothetical protein
MIYWSIPGDPDKVNLRYIKLHVMNPNYTQLEVLLITGTSLTSQNLSKKDEGAGNGNLSDNERLEEACWNGLLQTMLPEVYVQPPSGRSLYLWQIREGLSFLELNLAEVPLPIVKEFSITPQSFFSTITYN